MDSLFNKKSKTTTTTTTTELTPAPTGQLIQQEKPAAAAQQGKYEDLPILNTLPSGPELRDAIMAAKG